MDSINRAGPARLRTNELPRQKSPEVCARQRADRARLESRLTRSARRRRSNTRGTSAAGRGLLDRATALALRTSERLAAQTSAHCINANARRAGAWRHVRARYSSHECSARCPRQPDRRIPTAGHLDTHNHTIRPASRQPDEWTPRCPRRPGSNET